MSQGLREQVAKQIEEAFANTPYPGDENISPEVYEGEKLTADFKGKHWRDIPLESVFYHKDDLPFFTDVGFRFYLPIYLLAMLRHRAKVDTLPIGLLTSLAPPQEFIWRRHWKSMKKTGSFEEYFAQMKRDFLKRMGAFSTKERGAVLAFLEAFEQLFPNDISDPRELREAIKYWRKKGL